MVDPSGSTPEYPGTNTIGWEIMDLYPGDIVSTYALPTALFDISLVLLFTPFAAAFTHNKHLVLAGIERYETIINNRYNYILYLDISQYIIMYI